MVTDITRVRESLKTLNKDNDYTLLNRLKLTSFIKHLFPIKISRDEVTEANIN